MHPLRAHFFFSTTGFIVWSFDKTTRIFLKQIQKSSRHRIWHIEFSSGNRATGFRMKICL